MGGLFLTCTAINVPLLAHLRHQLECRLPDVLSSPLLYRLVTSRLAFTDTKDLVCSALLIYYFRWVGRTGWCSGVVEIVVEWCSLGISVRVFSLSSLASKCCSVNLFFYACPMLIYYRMSG